jgi:hypothetical protein
MEKNIISQVYCGGELYSGGEAVINDLKNSGFTSVVAWAVHVSNDGTLIYNDPTIVKDGEYVGNADWPQQLTDLKTGTTSVNRLIFSIGGWGTSDFANIQALIKQYGIGAENPLYQNLKVLKETFPGIDAIDFDDESLYDQDTTVQFSLMLDSLGYKVTFCPYMYMEFWNECLFVLNQKAPGLVEAYNLQCYAGGAYNNPQTWIDAIQTKMGSGFDATGFVYPGLWCRHGDGCAQGDCPSVITQKLESWNQTANGLQGGFIWLYSDIQSCESANVCDASMNSKAYAEAVLNGLNPQSNWVEKRNVAEYKGASWDNHVKTITSTTVEEAKKYADGQSNITYFFYCRGYIVLEPNHSFEPGTAVFFSGTPWYGSAQQCDAYEKSAV